MDEVGVGQVGVNSDAIHLDPPEEQLVDDQAIFGATVRHMLAAERDIA